MLELPNKNFKAVTIKKLQWALKNELEANEEMESIGKEIEDVKKNKMKILELQNTFFMNVRKSKIE